MTASATHEDAVPMPGYDALDSRKLVAQLRLRSQVELAHIEGYERSHKNRGPVLKKLSYLRASEPLDGYDLLGSDEILVRLSAADPALLGRVRTYETRLRARKDVLDGLARIRNERPTADSPGPAGAALADAGLTPAGAARVPLGTTVGIVGLMGIAAVLMFVLVVILGFLILAAVAPDALIH